MTGGRRHTAAPSGVVTFLFTDIEGSTRRWEADAQGMRSALAAHDDLLGDAVETHDGWLFKHTGDGICAAFTSPTAAVDAAVTAQRALELPVRVGIATGEAELRGEDYFGAVLNRVSRVMSAGHGGQILVDGTTAGLLDEIELKPLGAKRLRDIAKPVEVFQVQAAGLGTEFPPLKTADPTPGNLRLPTTTFVGREQELTDLQSALKAHRLVTLTGVGGVGKTRLALEVAQRSAEDFPDGIWVLELAAVGDPDAVPEAVAAGMGITHQAGLSVTDSVARALEGRTRLLVFDNCEHVLDAAADIIESILAHSETVTVLATSREGLRADDELLWPVPSLDVRGGPGSAAASLFVDRASAVARGVSPVDDDNAVAEICRRLDGIPLAIELAASRLLSMSVVEIRDRLDDRFRLLTGSRRGLERHQTLRHAVQWSYELLDAAERAVLNRCSVFAGGFDLAAAGAVTGSEDEFVTLDLLDALTRKSLLIADKSSGRTRFSMLETIRQYAEEQLAAEGGAVDARAAHACYFAAKGSDMFAVWDSPRQREAHGWIQSELPNLRTAFRWAADHDDLDSAAAIAVCATFLGYWVGQFEPIAWAEELLEPARVSQHRRLAQLYAVAAQCYVTGRFDDFTTYAQAYESIADSEQFDAVADALDATLHGGFQLNDPVGCVERCRARSATGLEKSYSRQTLAIALTINGNVDEAIAIAGNLLDADHDAANPHLRSAALLAYGFAYYDADPTRAREVHRRGLAIAEDSGNQQIASVHATSLARLAVASAEPVEAVGYIVKALRNYHDSGSFSMLAAPLIMLSGLLERLGHTEPAATVAGFAVVSWAKVSYPEIVTTITELRKKLGDKRYESLAHTGLTMGNAAMAAYAFDQIDQLQTTPPPVRAPQ